MGQFSHSLKRWRALRRFSQLELANEAGISARHLSFLETGRAQPSRDMVARLSTALQLPLESENHLLNDAGFAVKFEARDWNQQAMAPVERAIERTLAQHSPYPGVAIDRYWRVRRANDAALMIFGAFGLKIGDSLLDLLTSDAMPGLIENWPEVAQQTAQRLRVESQAYGGIRVLDQAADHLNANQVSSNITDLPVIPVIMNLPTGRLTLFTTLVQLGTPQDLTLADLKMELYFPMDEATDQFFQVLKG